MIRLSTKVSGEPGRRRVAALRNLAPRDPPSMESTGSGVVTRAAAQDFEWRIVPAEAPRSRDLR
jgi:hypothetical protein